MPRRKSSNTSMTLRLSSRFVSLAEVWSSRAGVSVHSFMVQALQVGAVDHARRLGVYREDDIRLDESHSGGADDNNR